jgi:hypothetical protein
MNVDRIIRALTALIVVGLGLVAAVVSFAHGLQVVQAHGQTGRTAFLTPLTVDGLVLTTELLMGLIRRGQVATEPNGSVDQVFSSEHLATAPFGAPAVGLHQVRDLTQALATDANASPAEVFTGRGLVEVEQLAITPEPDPDPLVPTARERFAEGLARGDLPSVKQVRTELRVGWPRAKQILAALATS